MFEENMPQFFSLSAPQTSKETFARLSYSEGYTDEMNAFRITFTKEPIENDWNILPKYTVYLPNKILQHLESDDAVFQFERNDFYVYDVWQTNEILWKESSVDPQAARYPLYASIGLFVIGGVLLLRFRTAVEKHKIILILLLMALGVRLFFGSFSIDFGGSDAAVYGNAATNIVSVGRLQVNYIAPEPHWIRAGVVPEDITHPFNNPARLLYSILIASSFALLNPSFFAIKAVDILLGTLLVIPTFYLAKKLFNEKTAIAAAAIVVFHPLLINYSGVLPSTGIMTAFLATSALCAMVYEGNKTAIIAGVFIGLSLFARMEFGFILLATVVTYYILTFKRSFFRKKSLYVTALVFLAALALLLYISYAVYGKFGYSTKILGGTFGETREPGLLETLGDPDFMQIRVYNAAYGWWYVLFMVSPLVFITAVAGVLLNIKSWRTMSALYLFPLYGVLAFSMAVREQPHARFIVEYIPAVAVLSASFIIALSQFLLPRLTDRPNPERNIKFKQILTVFVLVEIIFMSFLPHYLAINTSMQNLAWKYNDGELYDWIKASTSSKSVIMANSAVFVFHTDREIVVIPRPRGPSQPVDMEMIVYLIGHYKIDYLVIDYTTRSIPDLADLRSDPTHAPYGFNLVYWNENPANFDPRVLIYDVRALHG
jgi:4-amino-4-deoxy-L-arabinose transferase-like glycosyltransferase